MLNDWIARFRVVTHQCCWIKRVRRKKRGLTSTSMALKPLTLPKQLWRRHARASFHALISCSTQLVTPSPWYVTSDNPQMIIFVKMVSQLVILFQVLGAPKTRTGTTDFIRFQSGDPNGSYNKLSCYWAQSSKTYEGKDLRFQPGD